MDPRKIRLSSIIIGVALLLAFNSDLFASARSRAREAEKFYKNQKYQEAISAFSDAQMDDPGNNILQYNLSNAKYRINNYEEAYKSYQGAAGSPDLKLREKAFYNLGNAAYRQGKLDEAIEWYQKALELDPNDQDAKFNIEFVRDEIRRRVEEAKKNAQQQQPQQNQQGNKEQQRQQQGSGQGQEKPPPAEEMKKEGQAASPENREGQKKPEEQAGGSGGKKDEKGLDRQAAEQWLGTLEEDQRDFQRKQVREGIARPRNPDKDW
ncbi:MAG: tetratricopeptide repeat protein [Proteobacteria bacterium]|nr:tetratricopeptide repeat protein [Pseudomonadota bacterium]